MNKKEAKEIIRIMCLADNGCGNCVRELMKEWNRSFPEFEAEETEEYAVWRLKAK